MPNGFDNFFAEWKEENKQILSFSVILTITMFLALVWVITNIPSEASRANIFLWLLVFAFIAEVVDIVVKKNFLVAYVDFGNTWKAFGIALATGGLLGVFLNLGFGFSILRPLAIGGGSLGFFYTVIGASYVEEKFFRGFLNPELGKLFGNVLHFPVPKISGTVVGSLAFGIFHYLAYGGLLPAIFSAFIFGLIVSVGNQFFKSRGFGFGAHLINNFILVGGFTALAGFI